MSILKLITSTAGLAVTATATYKAQKWVAESLKESGVENTTMARLGTVFATSLILGGIVNSVVKSTYDNK